MNTISHNNSRHSGATLILLLGFLVLIIGSALAGTNQTRAMHGETIAHSAFNTQVPGGGAYTDSSLVLLIERVSKKNLLRVSFNGNEGAEGTLHIFNTAGTEVALSHFELIKSPYYATVDISSLTPGTYTAKLITREAEHQNELIIE